MKNIDIIKRQYLKRISSHFCSVSDPSLCPRQDEGGPCECAKIAEIKALHKAILPDGFEKYTFDDFDGQDHYGNNILSSVNAKEIKEKISNFCWNKHLEEIFQLSESERFKYSHMGNHVDSGTNIVIHGDNNKSLNDDTSGKKIAEQPLGRTFLGAILTRETIKLRLTSTHYKLGYEWIEFSNLIETVLNNPEIHTDYQAVDWLVIDNITEHYFLATQGTKSFIQSKLDPFFLYRLTNKLPTVLIFKFDISNKRDRIEKTLGSAINRIIDDHKTFNIFLKN